MHQHDLEIIRSMENHGPTRMLNASHAKSTKKRHFIPALDSVDACFGARLAAWLAAEVVRKDVVALGRHVAPRVLAHVLPAFTDFGTVNLELIEGVVRTGCA